jgi:hypothetical protein
MNLFRYVGDDPVDKTDPLGLVSVPSQRSYDQPLFLPPVYYPQRKIVDEFSTSETKLGTLIPTRICWQVTRQDFLVSKITIPMYDKQGHATGKREDRPKDVAYTESRISTTQQDSHNFTLRWDFDLQFRSDVGGRWMAFNLSNEPQHLKEIVDWAKNTPSTQIAIMTAAKQGLSALQSRADTMRHNFSVRSATEDLMTGRHTLRENGIDVPLNQ